MENLKYTDCTKDTVCTYMAKAWEDSSKFNAAKLSPQEVGHCKVDSVTISAPSCDVSGPSILATMGAIPSCHHYVHTQVLSISHG